jgi:DNA-directed RNA polymerase subunit RPC12/RpoP
MVLAKCKKCGATLIAPYDGNPYWCTECSYEDELKGIRNKSTGEL